MAFSDFKTADQVVSEFGLNRRSILDLFPGVAPVEPGPMLAWFLTNRAPRAIVQGTEIARREAIIGPFLYEAEARARPSASVFAGVALNASGRLTGFPDYVVGRGTEPAVLKAPLLAIVEAKEEKFGEGSGACVAAMVAAREINAGEDRKDVVFGGVTNGPEWFFWRLKGTDLVQQQVPVFMSPADRLLGVLVAIASGTVVEVERNRDDGP